jgi:hypothetical protein
VAFSLHRGPTAIDVVGLLKGFILYNRI